MELFCKNWGWVGGLGLFPPWLVWVWFCWAKKGEITQLGSPHNCGCYSSLIESKDMTATHHFQKHFCAISCVSQHHAEMRRYHSSNHDAQIAIPIITTLQAMEAGVLQIAAAISDHLITGVSTQLLWWANRWLQTEPVLKVSVNCVTALWSLTCRTEVELQLIMIFAVD